MQWISIDWFINGDNFDNSCINKDSKASFKNYVTKDLLTLSGRISGYNILNHYTPKLPSYRNQSIDLQIKSTDWFLYDGNYGL